MNVADRRNGSSPLIDRVSWIHRGVNEQVSPAHKLDRWIVRRLAVSSVIELRARRAQDAVATTGHTAAVVVTQEVIAVVEASEVEEASEVAVAGANGEGAIPKAKVVPQCVEAADPESKVTNVTPESAVHAPSEELKMPDTTRTSTDGG
jgi:hypothetical protein